MTKKVTSVTTHTGTMLNGTVTTEVSSARFGCKIDYAWAIDPKGNYHCIGYEFLHKGKLISVPFGQVKQWNAEEINEPTKSVASAKAS